MTAPDPARSEPGPDAGIDEIQADIEQTRNELGQTVDALSSKLDVKERAKEKADTVRHNVTDNPQRTVPVAAVVVVAAVAGYVIWRRRR